MGGRRAKYKQAPPAPLRDPNDARPSTKKLGKRKANLDHEPEQSTNSRPTKKAKGDILPKPPPQEKKTKGSEKAAETVSKPTPTKPLSEDGESDGWENASELEDADDFVSGLDEFDIDEDDVLVRGVPEELDLGSDDEEEVELLPKKIRKSKQAERPTKIIPTMSDEEDEDEDSDVDQEDGPITAKNIESRSRALDEKAAREAELDMEEMQNAAFEGSDDEDIDMEGEGEDEEAFHLPTAEERAEEKQHVADVHVVQRRMRECVRVLGSFRKLGAKGRLRSEYVEQLISDIASYYGYNDFLAEKLFQLFPVSEAIEFFEANEVSRPVTIRTNTLKTRRRDLAQALINRGVNLEPIGKWTNVGLQVFESSVPIGATPEYLSGHYMLQAASSFLPVISLSPQPNERVLDMASAPGGKTTHIAALLRNTGIVFANDANKARTKSLTANVHRLGCKNVIVCSYDGREFPKVMGGFDRVLLDAPCSGTGVISKDSSVKVNKSERDFHLLSHLQKQLILCAIDSVSPDSKTGGFLVYSTCSVTVDENEAVVDYALRKRPNVKLVDTGLGFGRDGFTKYRGKTFHPSVKLTKRFYPHVHNMDGFYVAKFKVEKRAKVKAGAQGVESADVKDVGEQQEDVGFDSEEDRAFIEEGKRRQLKAKGLRVPRRRQSDVTAEVAKTAA
ncbi:NOL1/NOP2/sun family putative RNA met [Rhizopogon vinicolor AM-OR11-026]|uniref:Nucleolar protein 2 n=1 Tax=Rhizopogon vinicolor AM-OR11-026 TaxID=1314800 RepID=A0A1B7NFA6_9AGAM|nr:NOL1/NOP2/sun family putative RNA met [Rhizopogon vinicolor AM-OR11-026]